MSKPICKLYYFRPTEAGYALSKEERESLLGKVTESTEKAGGKLIVGCSNVSTDEWTAFGVQEFPNIEAVEQHLRDLWELDWFRYIDSKSMLGIRWDEEES